MIMLLQKSMLNHSPLGTILYFVSEPPWTWSGLWILDTPVSKLVLQIRPFGAAPAIWPSGRKLQLFLPKIAQGS